jgi:hypothetical protein
MSCQPIVIHAPSGSGKSGEAARGGMNSAAHQRYGSEVTQTSDLAMSAHRPHKLPVPVIMHCLNEETGEKSFDRIQRLLLKVEAKIYCCKRFPRMR